MKDIISLIIVLISLLLSVKFALWFADNVKAD